MRMRVQVIFRNVEDVLLTLSRLPKLGVSLIRRGIGFDVLQFTLSGPGCASLSMPPFRHDSFLGRSQSVLRPASLEIVQRHQRCAPRPHLRVSHVVSSSRFRELLGSSHSVLGTSTSRWIVATGYHRSDSCSTKDVSLYSSTTFLEGV